LTLARNSLRFQLIHKQDFRGTSLDIPEAGMMETSPLHAASYLEGH